MKYPFTTISLAKIHSIYVEDEILELLDGLEDYSSSSDYENKIYNVSTIEVVLNDDDINENTKYELSRFLEAIKLLGAEKVLIVV